MKKIISLFVMISIFWCVEAQNLKKLGLIFDQTTFHFGDVEQWNNQPATFTFTNKSKLSLTILPLFSENDLDVVIPDKPILPGETIIIQAMYYTDGKGPFNRSFPIYFGSRAEPVSLKITGNIKSLSPHAYIQCPMSKPELSKPRIELVGDVAEINSEIPLSGTTLEIIGMQTKKEVTLFTNSRGNFGAKLPTGNYLVKVSHPNYVSYTGTIYIGQTSPPLRVRLSPINEEPLFVEKPRETVPERKKEDIEYIAAKTDQVKQTENERNYATDKAKDIEFPNEIDKKDIAAAPNKSDKLERDIEYVKNEPTDNPFSSEPKGDLETEIPQTLTSYKESTPNKDETDFEEEKQIAEKNIPQNEEILDKKEEKNELANREEEEIAVFETAKEDKALEKQKIKEDEKFEKPVKEIEVIVPKNNYVLRVLNKNTLEPIEDAAIYLSDYYNKKNKHNERTDIRGYSELEIVKSNYRFVATADGYISNETKIMEDDKTEVFKIFLSPISDLYEEIYEAKKDRAKENEELLEKLSFGKTEFTFAKDEPKKVDETETFAQNTAENTETRTNEAKTEAEPVVAEKIVYNTEKEDSLKREIEKLEALKNKNDALRNEAAAREENLIALRKQNEIDSLNNYIEELQANNNEETARKQQAQEEQKKREKQALEDLTAKAEQLQNEKAKRAAEAIAQQRQTEIDSLNTYISDLQANNDNTKAKLDEIAKDKQDLEAQQKRDKEKLETLESANEKIQEAEDNDPFSATKYQANNIMFLIDVSTSMEKANKMEMLKKSIKNLVGILRPIDRVAIISYNQQTNIVLESIRGDNVTQILNAIDSLKTGGLTNGVRGITTAYEMLEYYYIPKGNNQIILATDGLFSKYNNEMTENELNRLIKKQAEKNMKLTIVGFGKDEDGKDLMGKLAKSGKGQYIQIYNDYMTRDVLINEIKLNSEIK